MVFGLRTIGMGATVAVPALVFARLAAAEDVDMPPARVLILSDPALNTDILTQNIRAGLDLPFRVLSFAEVGQAKALYTNSGFLERRHGLAEGALGQSFDAKLDTVLSSVQVETAPAPVEKVVQDYGILELDSAYDFATTIERLRTAVMSQGDTVWFGEIDYAAEAAALGQDLQPATLLLFGGPAPGGVAMKDFPAIGLDAFCQKLLVYTRKDSKVIVLYNDIAALAELHYATSIKPHHGLNARLTETFSKAVE
ncbi:MAG: DUF302 domain-containing protein [Marinosulfonomonas sp.]